MCLETNETARHRIVRAIYELSLKGNFTIPLVTEVTGEYVPTVRRVVLWLISEGYLAVGKGKPRPYRMTGAAMAAFGNI